LARCLALSQQRKLSGEPLPPAMGSCGLHRLLLVLSSLLLLLASAEVIFEERFEGTVTRLVFGLHASIVCVERRFYFVLAFHSNLILGVRLLDSALPFWDD
jgi:hypothetical protein